MNFYLKISFFIITVLISTNSFGQKYSNEFLSIGVGARSHGMGMAQVANVKDATAGIWNPAGLMQLESELSVSLMHAEWFAGIGQYDYLAVAKPLQGKQHAVGLSLIRFAIDDIPNTLSLYDSEGNINYDNIVPFSAADYAFVGSYARNILNNKIQVGANAKIVHRKIGSFANSWGFGLDAGMQYKLKKWQFGVLFRDITTTFNAWTFGLTAEEESILEASDNDLPINSLEITKPQIIMGAAYEHQWENFGWLTEVNLIATTDGERNVLLKSNPISVDPVLGVELNYKGFVYLRGGVNKIRQQPGFFGGNIWNVQPNAGIGLKIAMVRIDYAMSNISEESKGAYSHVISLSADLNLKNFNRNKN